MKRADSGSLPKRPPFSRLASAGHVNGAPPLASSDSPSPVHNLIGLQNVDMHRVTDVSVILLQVYIYSMALLTPSTRRWQAFFVINAIFWRLWYSIGIGFILDRQSNKKWWTRHFVKFGESTEEAWRQWKGIYHLSMTMCYTSFICAAWKMYGYVFQLNITLQRALLILPQSPCRLDIWNGAVETCARNCLDLPPGLDNIQHP